MNFFNSENRSAAGIDDERPVTSSNIRAPLAVNAPINAKRSKAPMDITGINFFEADDDLIQEAKENQDNQQSI